MGDERDDLPAEESGQEAADDGMSTALPRRAESWRRRSATGAILTGFALGLRDVLEPEREEPSIMLETSGLPPKDLPVEADLEAVPPRHSVVKVRPWLLSQGAGRPAADAAGGTGARQAGETEVPKRPRRRRLGRGRRG